MASRKEVSREGYLKENYHYFHLRDTAGQERDFHFHDFDKIVLLLVGHVDYCVEDEAYALQPWDVLLVKHHTIHKAIIDRAVPYERVILYLDRRFIERSAPGLGLLDCFDYADRSRRYLLRPDEDQIKALKDALNSYEALIGDAQLGAQLLRDNCITRLLVHVNRLSAGAVPAHAAEQPSDPKIAGVLSYINENLTQELSVEALSEQVFLSRYHFMRLFKAQTGLTVHAYVRQRRLIHAARLIREGTPAARAALESGFADYSAFHRAFREVFGTSPGKLKA